VDRGVVPPPMRHPREGPFFELPYPFIAFKCKICLSRNETCVLVDTASAETHRRERHGSLGTIYCCGTCERYFSTSGGAAIHRLACKGLSPRWDFQCAYCSRSFRNKRGLGTHMRVHPLALNHRRSHTLGAYRGTATWSQGDTWTLLRLCKQLQVAGVRQLDELAALNLPGKTAEMVRKKRSNVGFQGALSAQWEHLQPVAGAILRIPAERTAGAGVAGPVVPQTGTCSATPAVPPGEPGAGEFPGPSNWCAMMRAAIRDWRAPDDPDLAALVAPLRAPLTKHLVEQVYTATVDSFLAEGLPTTYRRGKRKGRKRRPRGRVKISHTRFCYSRTQELFKDSPSILAHHVVQGTDPTGPACAAVPTSELQALAASLWGTRAENVRLPAKPDVEVIDPCTYFKPFVEEEVRLRVKRFKRGTAAGPDGVHRDHLTGDGKAAVLTMLLNCILLTQFLPTAWLHNRTVMIPKEGKDLTQACNYRPITVSALLGRLFWSLVDKRLRSVIAISPRQKGFVPENGCYNNAQILKELLRRMRLKTGGVVIQLDVKKAFDTAPHGALKQALLNCGIAPFIAQFVRDSYLSVTTVIRHNGEDVAVDLLRGVKQGDPMAPLLYTLLMEPLLEQLEELEGYDDEDLEVSALAFADDFTLAATNLPRARALLRLVQDYLSDLGMEVAASKCLSIYFVKGNKTFGLGDPQLSLDGVPLPAADFETRFRYLGVNLLPNGEVDRNELRESISGALARTIRLKLKPAQKLVLIRQYILPHYLHPLILSNTGITVLREIDAGVRKALKSILHLPHCVPDELWYVRASNGGFGLIQFEDLVPRTALKLGSAFWRSADPVMQETRKGSKLETVLDGYSKYTGIKWPARNSALEIAREKRQEALSASWAAKPFFGQIGAFRTNDPVGNRVFKFPTLLTPARLTLFLRALTNTTSAGVCRKRTDASVSDQCRFCSHKESIGHILGGCDHTQGLTNARHDWIRDRVDEALRAKGLTVYKEREWTFGVLRHGRHELVKRRPDLVAVVGSAVYIVDVTVRTEKFAYDSRAAESKYESYGGREFTSVVMESLSTEDSVMRRAEVLAVVVGGFGHVPQVTIDSLTELGICTQAFLRRLSLHTLDASLYILSDFLSSKGPKDEASGQPVARPKRGVKRDR